MLQAVILAGGLGTRLRPLTLSVPKPLVPVSGKPFLHHLLAMLRSQGVRRVLLLTGYRGSDIEADVGDGSRFGLELGYSAEPAPLGTGGALRNAAALLPERFLLLNGDTYLPIDYRDLVRRRGPEGEVGRIVASTNPAVVARNNLCLGPRGRVLRYDKHGWEGATHVDAGAVVLDREVLQYIGTGDACSLEENVYPRLVTDARLFAYPTEEPFYDIGSPRGLRAAAEILR